MLTRLLILLAALPAIAFAPASAPAGGADHLYRVLLNVAARP